MTRSGYRGYITSRPIAGERTPQALQNLLIRDYARRHGLFLKLSATEYAMDGCFMMLEQVLAEAPVLEGIICFSLFMLPDGEERRRAACQRVLDAGATLHCALENYVVADRRGIDWIEDLWRVRDLVGHCALP